MSEFIPREFIQLLLNKVDLVDLIHAQIPLRKKSGSNYFACCPFHQEKSASFSVSQPKQFYYCFGCGAHGNAIDFLMQYDHLPFPEAIETLARQFGMEVPHTAGFAKKNEGLPDLYDLMTRVTQHYYEQMCKSQRAINYLKNRGISGIIAQQFSLGYAPNEWHHLLPLFGRSEEDQKKLFNVGLIIKKNEGHGYYDRFRDRILFPIEDYRGRIVGFGGRIIDQGEPKYLNSPETAIFQKGHELYGLYQALKLHRKLDYILIVEGYMDVIALHQHGITKAVATLGTATTTHHLQRLFRYTSDIIFCFDGDQAGRTAAWRALQVIFPIMHDSLQVRFLFLPEGDDPDSLIRKEGREAFEKRLHSALSLSVFFFQTLAEQTDMLSMEGRARFASLALNHIKQLPSGLFQSLMVNELAKRARIEVNELKSQIQNKEEHPLSATRPSPTEPIKSKLSAHLRLALALLVQHPNLVTTIKENLPESDLTGWYFLRELVELLRKSPHIKTGNLLELWRGKKEENFLAKLAQLDHMVPENGLEEEFSGVLRQLHIQFFDNEINKLLIKASQETLSEKEKIALSEWINKKKALPIN